MSRTLLEALAHWAAVQPDKVIGLLPFASVCPRAGCGRVSL